MSLLVARDLWVRPPGRGAADGAEGFSVRGANLSLAAGEWVGITGPNGGGKTSLLLALAGLWPAARGEVRLEGEPIESGSPPRPARGVVATVLQDPGSQLLQPTVREEVGFAAANLGLSAPVVARGTRRWLQAFGLLDLVEAEPARLPAGFQQLVLLAGAMAAGPQVLIADEPGAHLDPRHRGIVLEALDRERSSGLAILWASQNPDELERADRILDVGRSGNGIVTERNRDEESSGSIRLDTRLAKREANAEVLLELDVLPSQQGDGPRVNTPSGFRLAIPSRGCVAVTGPNGAGKSVLLGAAVGLDPVEQVHVSWRVPPQRRPILVSQYPERLFFEELARDELRYAARARGLGTAEIDAAATKCFETLNIDPGLLMRRRMWELSGGVRRLVELVAALIAPAEMVALDEPTAGLDPIRRAGLARLISERAESSALLIASQDMEWLVAFDARLAPVGPPGTSMTPSLSKKTD